MRHRFVKLERLSDEVAWALVTPLFQQRRAVVLGTVVNVAFGLAGLVSTAGGYLWRTVSPRGARRCRRSGGRERL